MNERRRRHLALATALALLALAGNTLAPLAAEASKATRPAGFTLRSGAAGEGLTLAALGGLRTLTADVFWLRAYVMWERRDRAACTTFAQFARTLSPETRAFRTGYAEWLAFDFPHWSVSEAGGMLKVPEARRDAIHRADALAALRYLDEIDETGEARESLLAGRICDIKLKDRSRAASYYKRASETPEGPWYPTWLYVDALLSAGQHPEAVAFLRRYLDRVPPESSRAGYARDLLARLDAPAPAR